MYCKISESWNIFKNSLCRQNIIYIIYIITRNLSALPVFSPRMIMPLLNTSFVLFTTTFSVVLYPNIVEASEQDTFLCILLTFWSRLLK